MLSSLTGFPTKLFALILLLTLQLCAVTINGTFKTPDGNTFNGRLIVRLTRSTINNTCSTPAQVISFQPITVQINNGTLGSLNLYATSCLSPRTLYSVTIYDKQGNIMYMGKWNVPNAGSADVTELGQQ